MDEYFKKQLGNDSLSVRNFFCCIIVSCFFSISKEAICSSRSCVNLTSSFCRLSQYFCSVITSELDSSVCLVSLLMSISSGPNSCPCTRANFGVSQAEAAGALVYSIIAEGRSSCWDAHQILHLRRDFVSQLLAASISHELDGTNQPWPHRNKCNRSPNGSQTLARAAPKLLQQVHLDIQKFAKRMPQ